MQQPHPPTDINAIRSHQKPNLSHSLAILNLQHFFILMTSPVICSAIRLASSQLHMLRMSRAQLICKVAKRWAHSRHYGFVTDLADACQRINLLCQLRAPLAPGQTSDDPEERHATEDRH